jgi:predicted Zn-dependent peptidase
MALGGGMSSRLFQKIREEHGLCYTIFAQNGAYADTGMTTVYAGTGGDDLRDLAHLTIDEIKRAADDMSQAEIDRARAQMKAGLLMGLESPSSRAERMARMVQIWEKVPGIEETVAKIDSITLDQVRGFATQQATIASPTLALYGPIAKAPTLDDLQARRAA